MEHDKTTSQILKRPLLDYTDAKLFDLYHNAGLIEAVDNPAWSRENILALACAAYWIGAGDMSHDREGMSKVLAEHTARKQEVLRRRSGDLS